MQHRRTIAIATGLAIGLSLGVAPQAAGADVLDDPVFGEHAVWPIDALDAFVVHVPAPVVTPDAAARPAAAPTPSTTVVPTPVEVVAAEPAPAAASDSGSIRVEVAAVDGADRSVALRSADGTVVGTAAVTGAPIVFDGLPAGTYDLRVEQLSHGGGTFLTRTVLDLDGNSVVARCDDDTLDCSAS